MNVTDKYITYLSYEDSKTSLGNGKLKTNRQSTLKVTDAESENINVTEPNRVIRIYDIKANEIVVQHRLDKSIKYKLIKDVFLVPSVQFVALKSKRRKAKIKSTEKLTNQLSYLDQQRMKEKYERAKEYEKKTSLYVVAVTKRELMIFQCQMQLKSNHNALVHLFTYSFEEKEELLKRHLVEDHDTIWVLSSYKRLYTLKVRDLINAFEKEEAEKQAKREEEDKKKPSYLRSTRASSSRAVKREVVQRHFSNPFCQFDADTHAKSIYRLSAVANFPNYLVVSIHVQLYIIDKTIPTEEEPILYRYRNNGVIRDFVLLKEGYDEESGENVFYGIVMGSEGGPRIVHLNHIKVSNPSLNMERTNILRSYCATSSSCSMSFCPQTSSLILFFEKKYYLYRFDEVSLETGTPQLVNINVYSQRGNLQIRNELGILSEVNLALPPSNPVVHVMQTNNSLRFLSSLSSSSPSYHIGVKVYKTKTSLPNTERK
eukprot:CAMPEP_0117418830 /NCGR_PEP_ID=MMETSP0758-20121206/538_1 /TAXON_ID=63605 /ORGANISM="Percolomonas cosmopolitus, Strain AE-1 (ATCC 50343)" /LENGTH=485 /DNA_ID=CAMNT_0005199579 /DNA_START=167 /DNA_END=1621 /DNA_ORIENTATION=+